jgi:hypothetical protein
VFSTLRGQLRDSRYCFDWNPLFDFGSTQVVDFFLSDCYNPAFVDEATVFINFIRKLQSLYTKIDYIKENIPSFISLLVVR